MMQENEQDAGIIPRSMQFLFKKKEALASVGRVTLSVSYVEIYNEAVRDLMRSEDEKPADLYMNTSIPGIAIATTKRKVM